MNRTNPDREKGRQEAIRAVLREAGVGGLNYNSLFREVTKEIPLSRQTFNVDLKAMKAKGEVDWRGGKAATLTGRKPARFYALSSYLPQHDAWAKERERLMQKWAGPFVLEKLPEMAADFMELYLESVRIRAQYKRPVKPDPRELGEIVALFDTKLVQAGQELFRKSPEEFDALNKKMREFLPFIRELQMT